MTKQNNGPAPDGYGDRTSPFRPAARKPVLHRVVPVSQDLPGYRGGTLRRDLLAGITVAALALPSAMAYAELAGLSPVAGLYALLLPTVAYTLLGSCRQLIVGPEGSVAALVATALIPLAAGDPQRYATLAALLALLVGGVFLAARVVRLGWIADYFSRAVLIGYIHGVAVVLIVGQLGKLLGLDIDAQDPLPQLVEVGRELTGLSGATVTVGAACLGLLLVLRWRVPKLPGPLLVVVVAVAASWSSGWRTTAWPWSARSHRDCRASSCPTCAWATRWRCCRRRSVSSWSASPTRSSPPGPSRAGTASMSAPGRSCRQWGPARRSLAPGRCRGAGPARRGSRPGTRDGRSRAPAVARSDRHGGASLRSTRSAVC
jgi:hypothetical protein